MNKKKLVQGYKGNRDVLAKSSIPNDARNELLMCTSEQCSQYVLLIQSSELKDFS
jgi:hypothetical protein